MIEAIEGKPLADLIVQGASMVLTCVPSANDPVGRRDDVVIAIAGEYILDISSEDEINEKLDTTQAKVIDAQGMIVAPGFVDCHTHLVFGGSRAQEYAARMTKSAQEVNALGIQTGILASVQMTRSASVEELIESGLRRIDRMLRHGTTTVESKTGYGLTVDQELKMLDVNRQLQKLSPVDVVSTFLGAHDFPPEMDREAYVDLVVEEMTPREYFDKIVAPSMPLKRAQTPEDIGRAVVFLVSEDARNITGQSLNVNGGSFMQ